MTPGSAAVALAAAVPPLHLVLDLRQRRRRRLPHEIGDALSLLPWGPDAASNGSAAAEHLLLASASRRSAPETPAVLLSLANISPSHAVTLSVTVAGRAPRSVTGTVLNGPSAILRFPEGGRRQGGARRSGARAFEGYAVKGKVVELTVPATSVVVLTLQ